jgi:hypothetical protein
MKNFIKKNNGLIALSIIIIAGLSKDRSWLNYLLIGFFLFLAIRTFYKIFTRKEESIIVNGEIINYEVITKETLNDENYNYIIEVKLFLPNDNTTKIKLGIFKFIKPKIGSILKIVLDNEDINNSHIYYPRSKFVEYLTSLFFILLAILWYYIGFNR